VMMHLYPLTAATKARAIPVLPEAATVERIQSATPPHAPRTRQLQLLTRLDQRSHSRRDSAFLLRLFYHPQRDPVLQPRPWSAGWLGE